MENHFYHIRWPPLNVTIFDTDVCNSVLGATPMNYLTAGIQTDWYSDGIPEQTF